METNKRQHFISLFILSLLLSCSGEKKDSAQTETVSNKAIVRIETVSAQDVEQISEFTATVEANISNNIAPQNPVRIEKLFAEVGDHVKAGQLLVKMDETNLKQTKIQLDNQELEFKRIEELYSRRCFQISLGCTENTIGRKPCDLQKFAGKHIVIESDHRYRHCPQL